MEYLKFITWRQLFAGILLAAGLATSGCSGLSDPPTKPSPQVSSTTCEAEKNILLLAVEESGRPIPDVHVSLVNPVGSRLLGRTGNLGEACIARSQFDASAQEYITFCREGYFCGVFNVQKDIARFDERIIALARVVLR